MRFVLHIATLATVVLYSLSAPLLWGIYFLRTEAIASSYCVNSSNPDCKGKCHMTKIVQHDKSDGDPDIPPPLVEPNRDQVILFCSELPVDGEATTPRSAASAECPDASLRSGYPNAIDHPPLPDPHCA